MRILFLRAAALLAVCLSFSAAARQPVVLISIDGLRPVEVLEAAPRGLDLPNLTAFLRDGAYAEGVRGVLPTLTYVSHTTLITGVAPGRHGVTHNVTFDPFLKNAQGWDWYASDIRVPTLWDAARKAGLRTANDYWPVSVGAPVDFNLPQIWRAGTADDVKLQDALTTPGLLARMQPPLGAFPPGADWEIDGDVQRTHYAVWLLAHERPQFMTVYLTAYDTEQHHTGLGTPADKQVLERIDGLVGEIVAAARKADPRSVVAVVSDHGFAPLHTDVNLMRAFADAGLIRYDANGAVQGWEAMPWFDGGASTVYLRDVHDDAVRQRTAALLARLAADPALGIQQVLDHAAVAARGGDPAAAFMVLFRPGFEMAPDPKKPLLSASSYKGMHGYDPALPAMYASFFIRGAGIPAGRDLGVIDMRAIAPTLARLLGVNLRQAEVPAPAL